MAASSDSNFRSRTRILVVDDNEDLLVTIASALSRVPGYDVETLSDPSLALKRLSQIPYDLFLIDIRMPEIDGIGLLGHCRRLQSGAPVVLMTAYASVEQAVELMRMGADYYLSKPFSPEGLRDIVARVLERRAALQRAPGGEETFLTRDPATQAVLAKALAAADSEASVLIQGESGTGKELLARYVHVHSKRRGGAFDVVNSAAMPESLVEAILFGYERGAFTGATSAMPGRIEAASGGTLFVDEVGDMSLPVQAKVLRVMQDKTFQRLGDTRMRTADVRYVFATNKVLQTMLREKAFREDLYYRISVVELTLPPLRSRPMDVEMLLGVFLQRYADEAGRKPPLLSREAKEMLLRERWPGNVRQLQNFCQRAVIFSVSDEALSPESCNALLNTQAMAAGGDPNEGEKARLLWALDQTGGNISKTAQLLGISRPTVYARMRKYGLYAGRPGDG